MRKPRRKLRRPLHWPVCAVPEKGRRVRSAGVGFLSTAAWPQHTVFHYIIEGNSLQNVVIHRQITEWEQKGKKRRTLVLITHLCYNGSQVRVSTIKRSER